MGTRYNGYGPYIKFWLWLRGRVAGEHFDHRCRNKSCVNPWHLLPVTAKQNVVQAAIDRRIFSERLPNKKERITLAVIRSRFTDRVFIKTDNCVYYSNRHGEPVLICEIGSDYWAEAEIDALKTVWGNKWREHIRKP